MIKEFFTKGQFGKFYIAQDTLADAKSSQNNAEVIVKISKHLEMNKKEYDILGALNKCSQDSG